MTHPKRLFIAAVLAATGAIAVAQSPLTVAQAGPAAGEQTARPMMRDRGARMDPAQREQRRAEWHAQRMADLKAQLKLTPAQEGAWTAYAAAMQPPADAAWPRMNRDELSQLNTPQRIDRMQQLATERQTRMQERGEAVKAAVMVEEVAETVHVSRQLGEPLPIEQETIDRLYDRYQNVYGQ